LADIICHTAPLQYLHQLGLLNLLPRLATRVLVPPAIMDELVVGRATGSKLPDPSALRWLQVRRPTGAPTMPLTPDVGPGELEVIALALATTGAVAILDDPRARRMAEKLGIRLRGTLGLLIDAQRAGLVPAVAPLLDQLQASAYRLAPATRLAVLALAGEEEPG
jgi:predicted nucleic acid-binding protein